MTSFQSHLSSETHEPWEEQPTAPGWCGPVLLAFIAILVGGFLWSRRKDN